MKKEQEKNFIFDKRFWGIFIDTFRGSEECGLEEVAEEKYAVPKVTMMKFYMFLAFGLGLYGVGFYIFFFVGQIAGMLFIIAIMFYSYLFTNWANTVKKRYRVKEEEL